MSAVNFVKIEQIVFEIILITEID